MKANPIKRYRDPLSPKPILDRAAFLQSIKSNGIVLKNGQLDLFYQLLHRSGYPPLHEFVAGLQGRGGEVTVSSNDDEEDKEDVSVLSNLVASKFRTKNAVSSRPGRSRPQFPKSLLSYLAKNTEEFATITSRVQLYKTSSDGSTTKIAVELQDGHVVESVLMRHESRVTICVSSQVGCAMGCTFCATGTMGIRGNLSSGEILEQLVHGSQILASSLETPDSDGHLGTDVVIGEDKADGGKQKRPLDLIRNVVFMGMGEPLNNYTNVLAACRALIDRRLWNLAHNHVTVSTVGVPSRMRDLTRDLPEVNLALSLHAPNQSMREKIVPAAKGTPIESLIEALDEHMMALAGRKRNSPHGSAVGGTDATALTEFSSDERHFASKKKRAMIEYVMLEGDTSTIEAAHQLGKLCEGRHLVVNLIPYNKTNVKDKLSCPSEDHMQEFRRIVSSYGSFCSIRRTMGADIAGACGQLVVEEEEKQRKNTIIDIEDGPFHKGRLRKPLIPSKGHDRIDNIMDEDTSTTDNADPWLHRLTVATVVMASCFVLTSTVLFLQKRNRN